MSDTGADDLAKTIAQDALGISWWNTESAARRVAEKAAEREQYLTDERDALRAAIKRQAGAAKTLRQLTLDEVQHLKDADRTNHIAPSVIQGEREANAILSADNEALRAQLAQKEKICAAWKNNCQKNAAAMNCAEEAFGQIMPVGIRSGDERGHEPTEWAADMIDAMHKVHAALANAQAQAQTAREALQGVMDSFDNRMIGMDETQEVARSSLIDKEPT